MNKKEKEEQLYNEKFDVEHDIFQKLEHLIGASWDSNTLKSEIGLLLKQLNEIEFNIHELGYCKQCEDEKHGV